MRKKSWSRPRDRDVPGWVFWLVVVLVMAAKCVLAREQNIWIWVDGAPLDDELMFRAAESITAGQWLGAYDWLTLSKQMFFAVWLAACHAVRLPYLMAGQLLWCAASLAMVGAFKPALPRRWMRLLLFAALALSPASSAAYTLRVYRDNIFPALCLLFFAGMTGAALRCRHNAGAYTGWLLLAGLGLGLARITREDGIWLLPFAAAGSVITVVWVLAGRTGKKPLRCLLQMVPYLGMAVCVLAMSAMNWRWYGVFTTSDFSEGSFAAAYGAMSRVAHEPNDPLMAPVPTSVRLQLYEAVPCLNELRELLEENPHIKNGFWNKTIDDYAAGSFYWVLRKCAQEVGIYDDAVKADRYWQQVADEINAAIDDGRLEARCGKRSSTAPLIEAAHVTPTLEETGRSLVYCVTFQNCSVYNAVELSLATEKDALHYRDYLGNMPNYAAVENEAVPYYGRAQMLVYRAFDLLLWVYRPLAPVLLAAALILQLRVLVYMLRERWADGLLVWLVLLGVLGMAVLRCAMIAFMEVAAFQIGTYVMYLATVHPLLIVYGVAGTLAGLSGDCLPPDPPAHRNSLRRVRH